MVSPPQQRTERLTGPLDLRRTCGAMRHGRRDRCTTFDGAVLWRATRTPDGPATLRAHVEGGALHGAAWGPGAGWVLEHLCAIAGAADDDRSFAALLDRPGLPGVGLLRALRRRLPGLRVTATWAVSEALVPSVLEQKVTGVQAHRSWATLVGQLGEPAPGPNRLLLLPPPAEVWAEVPIWTFHRAGVERKRAATIAGACARAASFDAPGCSDAATSAARLGALAGVGPWTVAEVAKVALGDPDAVSVGDYHLKNTVVWNLAGRARGSDDEMLELLEPYRGHRGRVTQLLEAAGRFAPRFGPKLTIQAIEAI